MVCGVPVVKAEEETPSAKASSVFFQRALLFGLALALLVGAVIAHLRIASIGAGYQGRLAILDRAFDILLAVAISVVAFCVGRTLCKKLSLSFVGPAEELAFSVMLGTGVMGLTILGFGLAGFLRPLPVTLSMVLFLFIGRAEIPTLFMSLRSSLNYATSSRARLIPALLFGLLAAYMALRTITPPHCYDEAIYHLAVPKLFVQQGKVFPVVDNFMGDMPFLIHMIYAMCLIAKSDIAAKLFSLILSISTAISLYAFCSRFLSRRMGLVAMFAFFGAGMVVEVSITARVDVTLAGMIFLALYSMAALFETGQRGWFYGSALLSGFALGVKYTAFAGVLFVLVVYTYESLRRKTRLASVAKNGAAYLAISLALALPWLAKNAVWFHNPIYPYVTGQVAEYEPGKIRYYNRQDELKMDAFLDDARKQVPEDVGEEEATLASAASQRLDRHPLRFWEYFTKAEEYSVADFDVEPNYLFMIAPLLLLVARPRWVVWCALGSLAFYLCIAPASWVARYLLPVYPPLTIVVAYVLVSLADRARKHTRIAVALPAVVLCISLLSGVFVGCVAIYRELGLSFVSGSLSRHDFMMGSFYYGPIDYINAQVPAGEKVMMLGAEMGYDLNRPYIANAGWSTNEWSRLLVRNDSMEGVRDDLLRHGVRYILFSPGLFTFSTWVGSEGSGQPGGASLVRNLPFLPGTGAAASERPAIRDYEVQLRNWATFSMFASRFAEPVKAWRKSCTLYRIK